MDTENNKPESTSPPTEDPVPSFGQASSATRAGERSRLTYMLAGTAAAVVIVVIIILVTRIRPASSRAPVELTAEQKAYLDQISFSGAKMSAATNFLGQRVIYLDAQVSNQGSRAVKQIETKMEFTDLMGQVIFREQAKIFPPAVLPLKSGESRDFQLFFDHIPSGWNQAPPHIAVTSVEFE